MFGHKNIEGVGEKKGGVRSAPQALLDISRSGRPKWSSVGKNASKPHKCIILNVIHTFKKSSNLSVKLSEVRNT